MPCNCDYMDDHGASEIARYRALADAATRAACDLRTVLRRGGTMDDLTDETLKWVARHDIADARRIAEEEARGERQRVRTAAEQKLRDALKGFTLEERRVLEAEGLLGEKGKRKAQL